MTGLAEMAGLLLWVLDLQRLLSLKVGHVDIKEVLW